MDSELVTGLPSSGAIHSEFLEARKAMTASSCRPKRLPNQLKQSTLFGWRQASCRWQTEQWERLALQFWPSGSLHPDQKLSVISILAKAVRTLRCIVPVSRRRVERSKTHENGINKAQTRRIDVPMRVGRKTRKTGARTLILNFGGGRKVRWCPRSTQGDAEKKAGVITRSTTNCAVLSDECNTGVCARDQLNLLCCPNSDQQLRRPAKISSEMPDLTVRDHRVEGTEVQSFAQGPERSGCFIRGRGVRNAAAVSGG
ncbi:hypothetical protein DFH06DRAFT_1136603 [Mycena polygramma]|nr:hypothetical protein DFH06DRAFT_1136603 [Mycena polygramma]